MKIYVDQKHIDEGRLGAARCPVAQALCDIGFDYVFVFVDKVAFCNENWQIIRQHWFPLEVFQIINSYDKTKRMTPFDFELDYSVEEYERDLKNYEIRYHNR